jgi:hypothetical protein
MLRPERMAGYRCGTKGAVKVGSGPDLPVPVCSGKGRFAGIAGKTGNPLIAYAVPPRATGLCGCIDHLRIAFGHLHMHAASSFRFRRPIVDYRILRTTPSPFCDQRGRNASALATEE